MEHWTLIINWYAFCIEDSKLKCEIICHCYITHNTQYTGYIYTQQEAARPCLCPCPCPYHALATAKIRGGDRDPTANDLTAFSDCPCDLSLKSQICQISNAHARFAHTHSRVCILAPQKSLHSILNSKFSNGKSQSCTEASCRKHFVHQPNITEWNNSEPDAPQRRIADSNVNVTTHAAVTRQIVCPKHYRKEMARN